MFENQPVRGWSKGVVALIVAALALFSATIIMTGCEGAALDDGDGDGGGGIVIIDGSWQPAGDPDSLGNASGTAEPRVFFYAAGKANVVWTGAPDGYSVESNAFTGAGWTGQEMRDFTNFASPEPRIFSNGFNVSYAVWRAPSECVQVYGARIDGTSWGTAQELSDFCGGGDDGLQDIAFQIGEAEVAFAVWQENGEDVYASRHDSDWGTSEVISDIGGDDPRVAVDPSGNAMVIWRDMEYQDLRGNYYSGGSWNAPASEYEISTNDVYISGEKIEADLAPGPNGEFAAVWRGTDNKIYAAYFDGAWSSQTLISTSAWNATPHVTFTPGGDIVAVWDDNSYVLAARFPAGAEWPGGWEGPWQISPEAGEAWRETEIAADLGGNVFFVWGGDTIYARRYPSGADWATWAASNEDMTDLDPLSNWSEAPHISVDANGRAVVVWERDGNIYSKRWFE